MLGEMAQERGFLDLSRPPAGSTGISPLRDLEAKHADAHRQIQGMASRYKVPVRLVLRLEGPALTLLSEDPLELTPPSRLRFLHLLWRQGRIGDAAFLEGIPAEMLATSRMRLSERGNEHLVPVASGMPVSGSAAKGVLLTEGTPVHDPRGGVKYILLVDRIEAHHTTLLVDPDCCGALAYRGSPSDHFALIARERDFPYMVIESGLGRGGAAAHGAPVSVDFAAGRVYLGDGIIVPEAHDRAVTDAIGLLSGVQSPVPLRVNLDTAQDLDPCALAGTSGVGLVRTEHMLRLGGLQDALRDLAERDDAGESAHLLRTIKEFFRQELLNVFRSAGGLPVAVRLLDYPMHELGTSRLAEVNPMLGMRGLRQGLQWAGLYPAQIEAIFGAAADAHRSGVRVEGVEILVPLVNQAQDIVLVRRWLEDCRHVLPNGVAMDARLGAMIETPAAALASEDLARHCDFLSFGTNDLTQFSLALSREDYPALLRAYRRYGIMDDDPFERLHPAVFRIVADAARRAKGVRPSLPIGLCGAHAADPRVIDLCRSGLLDYLSVPRRQLPVVKLQAIREWHDHRA